MLAIYLKRKFFRQTCALEITHLSWTRGCRNVQCDADSSDCIAPSIDSDLQSIVLENIIVLLPKITMRFLIWSSPWSFSFLFYFNRKLFYVIYSDHFYPSPKCFPILPISLPSKSLPFYLYFYKKHKKIKQRNKKERKKLGKI